MSVGHPIMYVKMCLVTCNIDYMCVAVCCSVLQCVAVCCSVLQCIAVCLATCNVDSMRAIIHLHQHVNRARCRTLQCVAVCCSVLQCVAVCYMCLARCRTLQALLCNVCVSLICVPTHDRFYSKCYTSKIHQFGKLNVFETNSNSTKISI